MKKTIVYAATRNLYQYLPMAINSVFRYNDDVNIYVVCEDSKIDTITDSRVIFINASCLPNYISKESPNYNTHWTYMTFVRCCLSKILDEDIVLWLDIDTLVLGSLDELFKTDLTNKAIAGVMEPRNLQQNGIYRPYINTGVLLMNLKLIREFNLDEKIFNMINTQPLQFPDQDAINHICLGRINYLHPKYNISPSTTQMFKPIIVHFTYLKLWDDPHVKVWREFYVEKI